MVMAATCYTFMKLISTAASKIFLDSDFCHSYLHTLLDILGQHAIDSTDVTLVTSFIA